ncbi:MAG: UDP-N-acetylmuramate dehydrogenase [Candidatus Omnitrophica bacterium]|nr:UDP-N-acetylmuramate dehydrogenase [Candidatus Omnitrophota bacterium]
MIKEFCAQHQLYYQKKTTLSKLTTFRIGGPAQGLIWTQTSDQMLKTIEGCNHLKIPFYVLGWGSNILVSDDGLDCLVIKYATSSFNLEDDQQLIRIDACQNLDTFVAYTARQGSLDATFLSGIPGTIGGAIVGNAGAFGRQIGDILFDATVQTKKGEIKTLPPSAFDFQYRSSSLKTSGDVALWVRFKKNPCRPADLQKQRDKILFLRRQKHPDLHLTPSAGSFFKNIEPSSNAGRRQAAGWFLEKAGVKNLHVGDAVVFKKHANIIINQGSATAKDVLQLSEHMAQSVKNKFNIILQPEVHLLGPFKTSSVNQI